MANAFWSERVRDEACLRMMRPTSLPPLEHRASLSGSLARFRGAPPILGTMSGTIFDGSGAGTASAGQRSGREGG